MGFWQVYRCSIIDGPHSLQRFSCDSNFEFRKMLDSSPWAYVLKIDQKSLPSSYNFSNLSYMEHLLRDGGDLDSMDRSLIDYNPTAAKVLSASSNTSVTTSHTQQASSATSHAPQSTNVNGHVTGESSPPLPPAPPTLGWFNYPEKIREYSKLLYCNVFLEYFHPRFFFENVVTVRNVA